MKQILQNQTTQRDHGHALNIAAAEREIAQRAAEGEPMEHAYVADDLSIQFRQQPVAKNPQALGDAVSRWGTTDDYTEAADEAFERVLVEQGLVASTDLIDEIVCDQVGTATVILTNGDILLVEEHGNVDYHPCQHAA